MRQRQRTNPGHHVSQWSLHYVWRWVLLPVGYEQVHNVRERQEIQRRRGGFVRDVPDLSRHGRGWHDHASNMQRVYRGIHLHRDIRQYRVPRRKIPGVYDNLHKLRRRHQIQQ